MMACLIINNKKETENNDTTGSDYVAELYQHKAA